jgi:hypothetical protein
MLTVRMLMLRVVVGGGILLHLITLQASGFRHTRINKRRGAGPLHKPAAA